MSDGSDSTPSLRFLAFEFEVERELGRGGMAVVYLARERALGRPVALKVMRAELLEDAEAVARLEREARVVAQLAHPNVVMVHGIRRWEPHGLALVLQYVEGETLKARIGRLGPLPAGEIERVVRELAGALGYAHRRGIVHRDLKPENVYLEEETGRALLGDFGIARVLDEQGHLTQTGAVVGTPAYMAPEQIDGTAVDARSDVYSLGLVAYAMATGKQPWAGESLYSIIYKQKHEQLATLGILRTDLPLRLVRTIEGCLGKAPEGRWASAAALVGALDGGDGAAAEGARSAASPAVVPVVLTTPAAAAAARAGLDRVLEAPAREAAAAARESPSGETVKYARTAATEPANDQVERQTANGTVRPADRASSPATVRVLLPPPKETGAWIVFFLVAMLVVVLLFGFIAIYGRADACTPQLGCGLALDQFSQIPAGTFQMGSAAWGEQPVHSVTISRTFYMQKTEVTQGQWRAVMGSNPSYFSTCGDTCPVEQVNWDDITTFLQRLNAQTPGVTYRLPTEAEWEYAARAGTTGETYGTLDAIAWWIGNSAGRTHAAAGKQANAWGLYDMIGNVWEWVNDSYGSYSGASVIDPTGLATGDYRVLRGGSWGGNGVGARAADRDYDLPSTRDYSVGFRLVRTP